MIGSISNMSSLAGETMQRIPVPASRSSPSAIQRSTRASISALKRVSTRAESRRPRVDLVAGQADRVVAAVADPLLHRAQLVLGREHVLLALQLELPVRAVGDDRDHRLAGHVAAHDQDVGLVELPGIEELAPADVGAVDVGGEEDAHQLCPISSGSWYQVWRSPTRARSFQRVDFGASSMAVRSAATWAPGFEQDRPPVVEVEVLRASARPRGTGRACRGCRSRSATSPSRSR